MICVLLVEDNPGDVRLLQVALSGRDFEFVHVPSLAEAQQKLAENRFGVILLDLNLPDSSGFETVSRVLHYAPQTPIVVLTGLHDEDLGAQIIRAGAQDYLTKGDYDTRLLTRTIRYAIERKQAEEQLRMWDDVFKHAEWGVVTGSPDGNFMTLMNPAFLRMHGYTEEELIGKPIAFVFTPEEHPKLLEHLRRIHENGHYVFESVHIRKDGTTFPVLVNATAVKDEQGNVLYRVVNVQDITEFKRLEAEAVKAQMLRAELEKEKEMRALKDRFVSMVSHEFRTPLAVIQTSSDMLTRYFDRLEPARRLQLLQQIKDQTTHIARMIDDTLAISRVQSGNVSFNPESLDLRHFCHNIIEQMRFIDGGSHIFSIDYTGILRPAMVDSTLLRHVFHNVLSNAVKYSPFGTKVEMRVSLDTETICFQVSDSGIGIPEDDLSRLFEPFHRAPNVGNIQGTGLGLSIAKEYVEAHGGTLEIHSKINEGTTVIIRIPAYYTVAV